MYRWEYGLKTDERLQRDIENELKREPLINEKTITVVTKNGMVMLTGAVTTHGAKHRAKKVAHRVVGVAVVANKLEVRIGRDQLICDEEIAQLLSGVAQTIRAIQACRQGGRD